MQQRSKNIIISGGGTGGHIFPAVAIADTISEKADVNILFVGAEGKMEMQKVPQAGYPIKGLWISGLQRKITLKNLLFPLKLIHSLIKARSIIRKFKPDIAIGVGGYASGPTLRAASNMGIKTLIQEQNSFPGITNRWLAKKVDKICVAYDGMEKFFPKDKIVVTGNPIRKEVIAINGKKKKAIEYFGLKESRKTLLIIGGSQGALAINEALQNSIETLKAQNFQVLWQTGEAFFNTAIKAVDQSGADNIRVKAFINRMDFAYAVADLVVSRAGAIAISELCATGKCTVFVPLPTAAEDHQTKNAMALVSKEAGYIIKNSEVNEKLFQAAIALLENDEERKKIEKNISALKQIDAADRIADEIIKLLNSQN